ncbi:protein twisted gastrulation-like [Eupeodes corollae]|uniref:protein twisted gastrulation-like n=1 Tax=Eupeodes corollae TaxID=290404 RepID=UPI00248FBE67|nr:protein twisted gastrulation-like [Eupeodes corollae]
MLQVNVSLLILFCVMLLLSQVESCNEVKCASIVSKCNSSISCTCESKNCPCQEEFKRCLGEKYYRECCSCLEICPKSRNHLSKKSHVEEFDGIPELFNVLITSKSEEFEWDIVTFPVEDPKLLENDVNYYFTSQHDVENEEQQRIEQYVPANCSVIYLASCISWNKCRQSCHATGASSYRWFHDGCCECIGSECINYGLNESRCSRCPEYDDEHDHEDDAEEIVDDDHDSDNEIGLFDGNV